jgi:purine-binding chemotaxis protein CheW
MTEPLSRNEVLRARAALLARPPKDTDTSEASLELLEFRLAHERYAIETRFVVEVHPLRNLTPLPSTPPFVLGIANVRGRIVPVFDVKKFFALPEMGLTDLHRIILVRGRDLELGILADLSVGVTTLPLHRLHPPMPTLTGIGAEYLKGVTAERLIVLDMDRILADPRILVNEEVGS